jgi:SET domain-containing protein
MKSKPYIISETADLCVKKASTKGNGVFAKRNFDIGETIEIAPVLQIPESDEDFVLSSILGNYTFEYNGNTCIGLGYSSLYNHNFEPNASFYVSGARIIIKAVEAIKKGQEIELDYGWDDEHFEDVGIPLASPDAMF